MSDTPDERMTELSKKIGICNKNVKALMEMVKTLTEKIDNPVEKTPEEKEKIDEIFKKNKSEDLLGTTTANENSIIKCF